MTAAGSYAIEGRRYKATALSHDAELRRLLAQYAAYPGIAGDLRRLLDGNAPRPVRGRPPGRIVRPSLEVGRPTAEDTDARPADHPTSDDIGHCRGDRDHLAGADRREIRDYLSRLPSGLFAGGGRGAMSSDQGVT